MLNRSYVCDLFQIVLFLAKTYLSLLISRTEAKNGCATRCGLYNMAEKFEMEKPEIKQKKIAVPKLVYLRFFCKLENRN